jgi:hypothetical protein
MLNGYERDTLHKFKQRVNTQRDLAIKNKIKIIKMTMLTHHVQSLLGIYIEINDRGQ